MRIIERIEGYHDDLTNWRRDIHAHPELGFEEHCTSNLVAEKLAQFGYEVFRGVGRTGLVGRLRAGTSARSIGLRADMDALRSRRGRTSLTARVTTDACTPAVMTGTRRCCSALPAISPKPAISTAPCDLPACGGRARRRRGDGQGRAVRTLSVRRDLWHAQPAGAGGRQISDPHRADDGGRRLFRHRYYRQRCARRAARIRNRSGDRREPHHDGAADVVSRNVRPLDTAVLSVTQIHAGDAYNVIPEQAFIRGTVRAFDANIMALIEQNMGRIASGVASGFGATAELDFRALFPPLVNDAAEAEFIADTAAGLVGAENVNRNGNLVMASEDFSYMLNQRPGAYIQIGNGDAAGGCEVHNPGYDFNDAALPFGASLFVRLVERKLPPPP